MLSPFIWAYGPVWWGTIPRCPHCQGKGGALGTQANFRETPMLGPHGELHGAHGMVNGEGAQAPGGTEGERVPRSGINHLFPFRAEGTPLIPSLTINTGPRPVGALRPSAVCGSGRCSTIPLSGDKTRHVAGQRSRGGINVQDLQFFLLGSLSFFL